MPYKYKQLKKFAKIINTKLKVTVFSARINIVHKDWSALHLTRAHACYVDDWFMVFTEHLGYFVLHEDDVHYLHSDEPINSWSHADLEGLTK